MHPTGIKNQIHWLYPIKHAPIQILQKNNCLIGRILGTFSTYNKSSIVLYTAGIPYASALQDAVTLEPN